MLANQRNQSVKGSDEEEVRGRGRGSGAVQLEVYFHRGTYPGKREPLRK